MPKGDWLSFPKGEIIRRKDEEGGMISLSGNFNNINIFMRGGSILPYQDALNKYIPNTYALHEQPTELIIIPDSENHYAEGDLIFDDDSYDTLEKSNYYLIKIKFMSNSLSFENLERMKTPYNNTDINISKIKFFNMNYLLNEEEKYDIIIITLKNGNIKKSVLNSINDDNFEVDLTSLNLKFNEIHNMKFGQIKYKSNYY